MYDRSGSFDFVTGVGTAITTKSACLYRARIISEGDARVVIPHREFPDLASVHIKADRRQVPGECECERQSDVAQAGDADGFVF